MTRNILHIQDERGWGESSIGQIARLPITYEAALWFLLGLAALVLRLWTLDATPLSNSEARIALDSYALARGDALTTANPLFYGIQSVMMSIFGSSNLVVRLVSALAGVWVCLLPLLARAQMGRSRALAFTFILTLSPTLWFASRQAEGNILAWALAGTALIMLMEQRRLVAVICGALLLACGKDAISPLVILLLSTLLVASNKDSRGILKPSLTDILSGTITFVLASTMFLWRPSGLGDAFNGLVTWFAMLRTPGDLGLLRVVSGLLLYESGLLLSTIVSIALLIVQQKFNQIDAIWIVWIVVGLMVLLFDQSREVGDMLPLVIGCAGLATNLWADTIRATLEQHADWLTGAIVCSISVVMFVYAYLGLSLYAEQQQPASLLSVLLAFIMIVGTGIVCILLADSMIALRSIVIAYGICLVIYTFGVGFQLTQVRSTNPAEAYVSEATDPGVDKLVNTIETMSLRAYSDPNVMPIQVLDAAPPALRWALRNQLGVTYVSHLSDSPAALTNIDVKPEGPGSYVGSSFRVTVGASLNELRCQAVPQDSNQLNCLQLIKWYTQRVVNEKLVSRWILWLNSDTANKASGIQ